MKSIFFKNVEYKYKSKSSQITLKGRLGLSKASEFLLSSPQSPPAWTSSPSISFLTLEEIYAKCFSYCLDVRITWTLKIQIPEPPAVLLGPCPPQMPGQWGWKCRCLTSSSDDDTHPDTGTGDLGRDSLKKVTTLSSPGPYNLPGNGFWVPDLTLGY